MITKHIAYDLLHGIADENAQQVSLEELQMRSDVLSLHTPQTKLTIGMVDESFIHKFRNKFYIKIRRMKTLPRNIE